MPPAELKTVDHSASSVLATLRDYLPSQPISMSKGLQLADRLATRFLELYAIESLPIPTTLVSDLPRVRIAIDRNMPLLTSGSSLWDAHATHWLITLNAHEPVTRQRFTVFHEFFHIVAHPAAQGGIFRRLSDQQVERIADYFAGCVLVPKRFLTRAWGAGVQTPDALAAAFAASPQALAVRLQQVHLTEIDVAPSDWSAA